MCTVTSGVKLVWKRFPNPCPLCPLLFYPSTFSCSRTYPDMTLAITLTSSTALPPTWFNIQCIVDNNMAFNKNWHSLVLPGGWVQNWVINKNNLSMNLTNSIKNIIINLTIIINININKSWSSTSPGMALCSLVRVCTIESINSSLVLSRGIDGDLSRICLKVTNAWWPR